MSAARDTKTGLLQIGELSRICNVSTEALRHYDAQGLLQPSYVDASTKYRYYSAEQAIVAHNIKLLQSIGLSLDEIKTFMGKSTIVEVLQVYEQQLAALDKEARLVRRRLRNTRTYRSYFERMLSAENAVDDDQLGVVRRVQMERRRALSVRSRVRFDYPSLMLLYNDLVRRFCETNLEPSSSLLTIFHGGYEGIYHQPTDIELAFEVRDAKSSRENGRVLPAGEFLLCTHRGKYPSSLPSYRRMLEHARETDLVISGPVAHRLIVPIASVEDGNDTVFEIILPVASRS